MSLQCLHVSCLGTGTFFPTAKTTTLMG